MTLRRVAAVAVAVLLLHLNVVRADAACAKHPHAGQTGHGVSDHAMAGMPAGHEAAAQEPATPAPAAAAAAATHEESCDAPSQPECCAAFASCSLVLGTNDLQVGSEMRLHDAVLAALIDTPISPVASPDPPPPKA